MSLSVKCNVVLGNWKVSYHLAKNHTNDTKVESLLPGSEWKATTKNKLDRINTLMRVSITINPAQHQVIRNGYLLVELRRLVYILLEWSILHVALGDNLFLICTLKVRFYFKIFFVALLDDIPCPYHYPHVSIPPPPKKKQKNTHTHTHPTNQVSPSLPTTTFKCTHISTTNGRVLIACS